MRTGKQCTGQSLGLLCINSYGKQQIVFANDYAQTRITLTEKGCFKYIFVYLKTMPR